MAFDFKRHLIKVQGGRTYLPVSARIVWFREQHPDWGVITEAVEINHEKQYAVFRATIFNAEGKIMATGTKKEDVKGFGDYMEKAETGSVGRALALCGFGTQFSPELDEVGGGRLADSPQPMGGGRYGGGNNSGGGGNYGGGTATATAAAETMAATAAGTAAPLRAAPRSERPGEHSPRQRSRPDEARRALPPRPPRRARPPRRSAPRTTKTTSRPWSAPTRSWTPPRKTRSATTRRRSRRPARRGRTAVRAEAKTDGPPACGGCGKALTKAQNDLSIRNYGEALAPPASGRSPARSAPPSPEGKQDADTEKARLS